MSDTLTRLREEIVRTTSAETNIGRLWDLLGRAAAALEAADADTRRLDWLARQTSWTTPMLDPESGVWFMCSHEDGVEDIGADSFRAVIDLAMSTEEKP